MPPARRTPALITSLVVGSLVVSRLATAQADPAFEPRVDSVFARWTTTTPGCAVGVSQRGRVLLTKGYGMANLEYGVPLGAGSVMESGSVAKQFTSAAIVLLQLDGKLRLDDDIRTHLPEVPDFGAPITIRNLLTHTSGLRDQWGLLSLTGNPPGQQVHTLPLILHLVTRQQELNFRPGAEYLYSNTGYALAAIIVERVSGKSLAQFSKERLFGPLDMTHTEWRDDHQRIVAGRATAYQRRLNGTYATLMPFTNVYGNGGLLSTMADLLKWNEALTTGTVPGGKALVEALEGRMRLTSGVTIPYALGLRHDTFQGRREVAHSGSTAGYSTYMTRFPDDGVSIAVWCSASDANPTAAARRIASLLLPSARTVPQPTAASASDATPWVGRYRNEATDDVFDVIAGANGMVIRMPGGSSLAQPAGAARFRTTNGITFTFRGSGPDRQAAVMDEDGGSRDFRRSDVPAATGIRLEDYVGTYRSPEVGADYLIRATDGKLVLQYAHLPPESLAPSYHDGFSGSGRTVRFVRDASGRVTELRVFAGRVRNVKFVRVAGG
ncbi:MAG: serine hydrolase [Gemmatimonadetes bacterium]|nr:serine hydrolase [Gemmatimonadota bacterium]